jgi:hypothetical protein
MEKTIQDPVWLSIVLGICVGGPLVTIFICRLLRMIEVISKSSNECRLKRAMVEKNYPADQIQKLLDLQISESWRNHQSNWQPIPPAKPVVDSLPR